MTLCKELFKLAATLLVYAVTMPMLWATRWLMVGLYWLLYYRRKP
jgi:hypothetical protein